MHMMKVAVVREITLIRLMLLVAFVGVTTAPIGAGEKPNVVIILADDLGYADLGVYGCKDIPTPHIDKIAMKGVQFTRGYVSQPVCAPSRAGLMSGLYSQRFGFENNSGPEKHAPANFGLPRDVPILAEKLKEAGYRTGLIGKWHLGFKEGLRPNDRGFDYFFGFVGGSRSYFPQKSQSNAPLVRNGAVVNDEKEYLTDAFAREAVDFLRQSSDITSQTSDSFADSISDDKSTTNPFFLYLAFNAVHLPMEAIPKYEKRFQQIYDPKRRNYAGMLSAMDDAVGRVMTTLAEMGEEDNTLVFFCSDNGGPTPYTTSSNKPLRGIKGDLYEGGIRVPFLMQWTGKLSGNRTYDQPVITFDCHATALAAAGISAGSIDGRDLLPYLKGESNKGPHPYLCWRFGDRKAITSGDWKLVQPDTGSEMQLYNISKDISEKDDLAAIYPDKVRELSDKFAEWERQLKPPAWQSSGKKSD